MATELVRFETNVPQIITLKFDDGKDVEGRYGDQLYYTLEGAKGTYFPPIIREKFAAAGVRAGIPVQVCKREVKTGNRKAIQWEVEKVGAEAQPAKVKAPAPVPQQTAQQPAERQPQAITPGAGGPHMKDVMARAGCAAVDVARLVEAHAEANGYRLSFSEESVRAIMLTFFIQHTKGGR